MANHVDSISLIDGITKTTVWGNEQKDPGVEQKWKEKGIKICWRFDYCAEMI